MNNTTKQNKNGSASNSGRKHGSFSFVQLTMAQLATMITDPNALIMVGKKYAESKGFTNLVSAPAIKMMVKPAKVKMPKAEESATPAPTSSNVVQEVDLSKE